jgi:hypothetical protein
MLKQMILSLLRQHPSCLYYLLRSVCVLIPLRAPLCPCPCSFPCSCSCPYPYPCHCHCVGISLCPDDAVHQCSVNNSSNNSTGATAGSSGRRLLTQSYIVVTCVHFMFCSSFHHFWKPGSALVVPCAVLFICSHILKSHTHGGSSWGVGCGLPLCQLPNQGCEFKQCRCHPFIGWTARVFLVRGFCCANSGEW